MYLILASALDALFPLLLLLDSVHFTSGGGRKKKKRKKERVRLKLVRRVFDAGERSASRLQPLQEDIARYFPFEFRGERQRERNFRRK